MIGGPVTDTAGGPADVAGHRAWLSPSEDGRSARAAAEVGPPGPRPACADAPRFDGTSGKRDGLDDMLRKLLATLLTRLAHDGPVTPVEDSYGHVPLRPTPPVPGVRLSDLPRRVQGLVLCTAMANTAQGGYWTDRFGQCVSDDLGRRAVVDPPGHRRRAREVHRGRASRQVRPARWHGLDRPRRAARRGHGQPTGSRTSGWSWAGPAPTRRPRGGGRSGSWGSWASADAVGGPGLRRRARHPENVTFRTLRTGPVTGTPKITGPGSRGPSRPADTCVHLLNFRWNAADAGTVNRVRSWRGILTQGHLRVTLFTKHAFGGRTVGCGPGQSSPEWLDCPFALPTFACPRLLGTTAPLSSLVTVANEAAQTAH